MGKWSCCVPLCTNYKKEGENMSWHSFPKNKRVRKMWILKIRQDTGRYFELTKNTRVCGAHFKPTDFKPILHSKKKYLKENAVPSIFFGSSNTYETQVTSSEAMPLARRGRRPSHAPYNPRKRFYNVPVGADVFAEWRQTRDSLGFTSDDKLARYLLSKEFATTPDIEDTSSPILQEPEIEIEEIVPAATQPAKPKEVIVVPKPEPTKRTIAPAPKKPPPPPPPATSKSRIINNTNDNIGMVIMTCSDGSDDSSPPNENTSSLRTYLKTRISDGNSSTGDDNESGKTKSNSKESGEAPKKPRVTIIYDENEICSFGLIMECESG